MRHRSYDNPSDTLVCVLTAGAAVLLVSCAAQQPVDNLVPCYWIDKPKTVEGRLIVEDVGSVQCIRRRQGGWEFLAVAPVYPRDAFEKVIEGYVDVTFHVNADGKVIDPRIRKSQPPGVFDEAVLTALQDWRVRKVGGGKVPPDKEFVERFDMTVSEAAAASPSRISTNK